MKIASLQINHLTNPMGYQMSDPPVLSYKIEEALGTAQVSAQITVTENGHPVYDSGEITQRAPVYPLDIALRPRTRYLVTVTVTSDADETATAQTWFETGKREEAWQAQWIGVPEGYTGTVPAFCQSLKLEKPVENARLYVGCAGLYAAKINGSPVDHERLTPFCNDYSSWMQTITHDVTGALKPGENSLEFTLANGWYKGRFGLAGQSNNYGDKLALLCELHITYTDGTKEVVCSGDGWTVRDTVFASAELYDGVVMDYTRNLQTGYAAQRLDMDTNLLQDRLSPPVTIQQTLAAAQLFTTPRGETCLDMGQNMVGWLRIDTSLFPDKDFTLRFFEVLSPDKNVYVENLRSAKQAFVYKTDGKARIVEPEFTFYGFRYVWIDGIETVDPASFTGCVVHSSMEQTGNITTSNPLVNRLFENAVWGQRGNFVDTPTDCPQRDERLGWTGDAQVFCGTAAFNMDTAAFFAKYLYDLGQEQQKCGGAVPHFVPSFGDRKDDGTAHSSCAWGDVATVLPWTLYVHTGDKSMLKRHYPIMKAWVEYIRRQASENHLWDTGFHFGDWLALDTPRPERPQGTTPNELVASAYYLYSTRLAAKAAAALGYDHDAREYDALAQKIHSALQSEFITPSGRVASDTQTANVLALFMDFATDKARAAGDLNRKVLANDVHLNTGFVGTAYLCRTLSDNGFNDTAWNLLTKSDYPSWLYEVKMGATTIWERWNSIKPDGSLGDVSMNSYNHYAYGAVVEWMYRNAAGINPIEDGSGCGNMRIAPQPGSRMEWLEASYHSPCGLYRSAWRITPNELQFTFEIPFNGSAQIVLPDAPPVILVDGKETPSQGLILKKGVYQVSYRPTHPYYTVFNADSGISDVLANPKMHQWLNENLPAFAALPHYLFLEAPQGCVRDFLKHFKIGLDTELEAKMAADWASIRGWEEAV